ncbi:MAG: type I DNA topoisomerase [Deltaproteobacteria bacterium]|jgi:DNA topoisomerase-1|nr:type I DNA topoisomerase [Deltaproteobacteria bacterium]
MKLLIVESPGKVKKIQSFLGSDWKVAASVGHVRDLPRDRAGVYPPNFEPQYVATERGEKIIADLKRLTDQAEMVYLATDPDREGEAIAWHLKEALELTEPQRVTYSEITETAIKKALAQPRLIDDHLVKAQLGRRVLDRLVGYGVSPAVTRLAGKNLSAGRVQTPALRLVVEREEAIRQFKSVTHYGVEMRFGQQDGSEGWKAVWNPKNWLPAGQEYFLDKARAEKIAALPTLKTKSYEEGQAYKAPPPPFTTSTLQQAASNSLKLDPKQTMALAQKLYEAGHITYMRTDSQVIAESAIEEIRQMAKERDWPWPEKPRVYKSKKGAQEAHEAIRPTHFKLEKVSENEQEQALYKLIWQRAVASQLADAVYATAKASLISSLDEKEVLFEAKGSRILTKGWKIVLDEDQADENSLDKDKDELNNPVPRLTKGQDLTPTSRELKTKKTQAPPRYTLAALIRDLEKRGIGRPSTYAAIMDNISSRQYIQANKKRQLESTKLGDELISFLKSKFGFVDYDYTKLMEEKLDDIAQGKLDYLSVVTQANDILSEELKTFGTDQGPVCQVCGQPLRHIVKEGPDGYRFWACSDRENCGTKYKDIDGQVGPAQPTIENTDEPCPDCGRPLQRVRRQGQGAFDFFSCNDREFCGSTFRTVDGRPGPKFGKMESSNFPCPKCGQPLNHHVKDDPGGYNFWACSDREKCGAKYRDQNDAPGQLVSAIELTDRPCPECGQFLRHIVKEDPGGYNFWACSDNVNCRAKFKDNNGQPGRKTGQSELTDHKCSECGELLRHFVKNGSDGYNFWACSDKEKCGATFNDNNGEPGEKNSSRQNQLTDHKCPDCGEPLRHLTKEGPNGYNFWACQDREKCGATFNDQDGEPGDKTSSRQNQLTDHKCPDCGQPLRHLTKEGPDGYNFWACQDRDKCGAKFNDQDGQPGQKTGQSELTDHKCPDCGQPLRHLIKDGPNGYNFWACQDRDKCGAKFSDQDGQPGTKNSQSKLTAHKCPDCGQALQHIVKNGPNGYNFWSCSDRNNCGAKFRDDEGRPGEKIAKREMTTHKCNQCGQSLYHLVKDGPNGYNFWACSNRDQCGATFRDIDGSPNIENTLKSEPSDHKCPECGEPLIHIVRTGPNNFDQDFWGCQDRVKCGSKYHNENGQPGVKIGQNSLTDYLCQKCGKQLRHIVKDGMYGHNFWACSNRDCGEKLRDKDGRPEFKNPPQSDPS